MARRTDPPRPTTPVTCVELTPWPLTLLRRAHPGVPVAVLDGQGRITHACPLARAQGVERGLRGHAALSRAPELHAEAISGTHAAAAWEALMQDLHARFSDRVDGTPGTAFLALGVGGARELAAALQAPVGVAGSREVAQLAARRARPGELRDVRGVAEAAFLPLVPLTDLDVLGVPPARLEALHFLGVRTLGDLTRWSPAQREAFLGVDAGTRVNRFLTGARTTAVARRARPTVLEATLVPDAPLLEPGEAQAALHTVIAGHGDAAVWDTAAAHGSPGLWTALRGQTASTVTVRADTPGGELSATRALKWPLDAAGLTRLAELALADAGALALGVERLTVSVGGVSAPARLVGLWAGVAELDVTHTLLTRCPGALVRVQWLDPHAYVADAQYAWVDWVSGQVRPTPLTPVRTPPTRARARERAVQRVLAFFEGPFVEGTAP
ncbi:Y-family DNA polymerase [uncultured Deinococcus sp.]|uniref:Y-family DNA polymerase n=1 Tax=uncultured Deinococcus sp. TaxID=158789 RepID=UPI0025E47C0C|nr:Y-family DNA polymerase [uncultured Deinococcus sp.]